MSDINDIEGMIQRDKDRISQLEITYKERSEEAITKIKNHIESSDVVKRLDEITDYINSKQDANWKTKPFIGSHSFEITTDSETFVIREEHERKKPKRGFSAETPFATSVSAEFRYIAQTEKPLWGSAKWSFIVEINIDVYEFGDKVYWAYYFDANRNGGLDEKEFWKEFKNEIAERYS